jgi:DNA-binding LacI/PurR family transcriptional regulator
MKNIALNNIHAKSSALPLYRQIADSLRSQILSGAYPQGTKLPPEAELSASLAVNHQTLRKGLKILSEQGLISQCQGRGTFVRFRRKRPYRIGIVISDDAVYSQYYSQLLVSLFWAQKNAGAGEQVLLNADKQSAEQLMSAANQAGCSALLALGAKYLKLLTTPFFEHLPVVFINLEQECPPAANRFIVRLADGAILHGVEYLYQLGHRRIAYISVDCPSTRRRNHEFCEAIKRFDLENTAINASKKIHASTINDWYVYSRNVVRELLSGPDPPSALICPGVVFSHGAWQGAMDARCRIPEDVSVLGFDVLGENNPFLSSLTQPIREITTKAIEMLLAQQEKGKHLKQNLSEIPVEIVERGSCRPL